jgi:hypothetical protein
MANSIVVYLDEATESIKKAREKLRISTLPPKEASAVRQRINKIVKDSQELLLLIKEEKINTKKEVA